MVLPMRSSGWRGGIVGRDPKCVLYRITDAGKPKLVKVLAGEVRPTAANIDRLTREYALHDALDPQWAVCPSKWQMLAFPEEIAGTLAVTAENVYVRQACRWPNWIFWQKAINQKRFSASWKSI